MKEKERNIKGKKQIFLKIVSVTLLTAIIITTKFNKSKQYGFSRRQEVFILKNMYTISSVELQFFNSTNIYYF